MARTITSYTHSLNNAQVDNLRMILEQSGFIFKKKDHALFAATGTNLHVTVYEKGPKVLIQGKNTEEFVRFTLEPEVLGTAELGYEEERNPEMFEPHFGIDESGKGDFFGPLVVAGAYTDRDSARTLLDAGVMDSKKIADPKIKKLASLIRKTPGLDHEVIMIGPEKYNELYKKIGNLNKLLAWGHAAVIEKLCAKRPDCQRALSDQFANPSRLRSALGKNGREIQLQQRTKAESDITVAAASILARDKFVWWIEQASVKYGLTVPKGASSTVRETAGKLVEKHGKDILFDIAKTHFRTASEWL
ncbi:MAG: ribonuclease HIII [Verrucomicrobiaceae bacterium]|nr:ribonuclease HIII [Verrucomicrobiaceae bacterium]